MAEKDAFEIPALQKVAVGVFSSLLAVAIGGLFVSIVESRETRALHSQRLDQVDKRLMELADKIDTNERMRDRLARVESLLDEYHRRLERLE